MESGRQRGAYTWRWFGQRFGFEHSPIYHGDSMYMDRYILYFFGCTLRLHKICRPDHDRALHNHPFWFITFPLGGYREVFAISPDEWPPVSVRARECYGNGGWIDAARTVRPFCFHFRGVDFRHRIVSLDHDRPIWTIVLTGPYAQKWGFFPDPLTFIPWDKTNAQGPIK